MKRLWSTYEFTLRQERRRRKLGQRRHHAQERQRALRKRPTRPRSTRSRQQESSLRAPETLSLFDEPNETLKYCNTLRRYLNQRGIKIFLDLGDVQHFTSDALLLIRAIIDSSVYHNQVSGNLPRDPTVASEFKASGFFAGFANPPSDLPPAKGLIQKRSSDKVLAEIAAELVNFAEEHVPVSKERANACYRTLVMTNTHNHAGDRKPAGRQKRQKQQKRRFPQKWFVSVYCRDQTAYFSFIDLGIGILNSKPAKDTLQRTGVSLLSYGRTLLLKDAFNGTFGSATGRLGRGLGLPTMKQDAENGKLPDLRVLTSDVGGSVADLDFRAVAHSLRGTTFRWCTRPEESNND